jgi:hypothetical protein
MTDRSRSPDPPGPDWLDRLRERVSDLLDLLLAPRPAPVPVPVRRR